jgi:hypothetical protein
VQPHLAQLWPNVVGIGVILQVVVEQGAAGSRNGKMEKLNSFEQNFVQLDQLDNPNYRTSLNNVRGH